MPLFNPGCPCCDCPPNGCPCCLVKYSYPPPFGTATPPVNGFIVGTRGFLTNNGAPYAIPDTNGCLWGVRQQLFHEDVIVLGASDPSLPSPPGVPDGRETSNWGNEPIPVGFNGLAGGWMPNAHTGAMAMASLAQNPYIEYSFGWDGSEFDHLAKYQQQYFFPPPPQPGSGVFYLQDTWGVYAAPDGSGCCGKKGVVITGLPGCGDLTSGAYRGAYKFLQDSDPTANSAPWPYSGYGFLPHYAPYSPGRALVLTQTPNATFAKAGCQDLPVVIRHPSWDPTPPVATYNLGLRLKFFFELGLGDFFIETPDPSVEPLELIAQGVACLSRPAGGKTMYYNLSTVGKIVGDDVVGGGRRVEGLLEVVLTPDNDYQVSAAIRVGDFWVYRYNPANKPFVDVFLSTAPGATVGCSPFSLSVPLTLPGAYSGNVPPVAALLETYIP